MLESMRRLDRLLQRIEQRLCALLLLALMVAQLAEILLRNLGIGLSATLFALSPALVLWLSLVGASLAQQRGRHITLALLPRILPPAGRRLARLAGSLCGVLSASALLLAGLLFVRSETAFFGIRHWPVLVYPLFFAMLLFRFVLDLAETRASGMDGKGSPSAREGAIP